MKLLTEVSLPDYPFTLNHRAPILMMGSCFTDNIGRLLERYLFPACINPFGVTYNPLSVKRGLEALIHKDAYGAEDLDRYNDLWFSFDHYTGFSSPDQAATLQNINHSFKEAKEALKQAGTLILTWGTSWVYRFNNTGEVVCNCHKIPAKEFTRTRLTTREIIASSALLLAGDVLGRQFPQQFFYFPSYEIVMDELRDYRFYTKDMLHTSDQATRYIWEKFQEALICESSREIINDLEPLLKMLEHRPLNRDGEPALKMTTKIQEKREILKIKYPELDWGKI
jgi:hypothetical protein